MWKLLYNFAVVTWMLSFEGVERSYIALKNFLGYFIKYFLNQWNVKFDVSIIDYI